MVFNPSTAFQYRIYRNLSRQKARKIGLFYFYFMIKKDNFKKLLGRVWGEDIFIFNKTPFLTIIKK
jgi:hypothetical protein|nr:MAG TPA: hypothetical protein [Caudoviricetes sp.]DAX31899.1 MAG TPA: hypothetical protein [Caudoviricetes sp.]